jgi:AraC-like DNA-binding protein
MQMTREQHQHTVPVALARQVVELVQRWHVPQRELLEGTGLPEAVLDDPLERLPVAVMCNLLQRARLLTGEPGLGYYLGLKKRASAYGYLGFAAQSARTLREVLELAIQYAPVFSTALTLDLSVDEKIASLRLEEHADFGAARDIVLISMMLGFQTIGASLTGIGGGRALEFAMPEPEYYRRFAHLAPNTRFGQPVNRLIVDAASLDHPVVTADATALQLARQLCERALDELGFDAGLVDRVRRCIPSEQGGFRSLEQVAMLVHLSPRTLKRRLAAQGVSFSALLDRERREKALVLLRSSRLGIDVVAERLDYSSASTFVRAFHRWTGTTPAAYRRERWKGAAGLRPS